MKKVLIIIPAYNEALNIKSVVKDIEKNAKEVDYIIINDCSKDNTEDVCLENNFNHITLFSNLGLAGAVQTGFLYAYKNDYDIAIQFDGDGQHMAKYIKDLVETIESGHNIAIGSRFVNKPRGKGLRMLGSRLITFLIKLITGITVKDPTSGMRAYDKDLIKECAVAMNNPPEPDTLVHMINSKAKIKEIQVDMRERKHGESYLKFGSSIKYMIRMVISVLFIQPFRKTR